MAVWVYVIVSAASGKTYTGITARLEERLREHDSGHTRSTAGGAPWKLVWSEAFQSHGDARKREKQLKSRSGRAFIGSLINGRPESGSSD